MKKVLLGTTALVAAGAFAGIGAAQAQDMMVGMQPLEVGGYYTIAAVSTSDDDPDTANNRSLGIDQNIELEGRGSVVLDNGITAGVRIRINGNNGGHEHTHDSDDVMDDGQTGNADADSPHAHAVADGGDSDDDNISEAEVYFTGSFGGLHIGMIEAASQQMTIWAPGGNVPIGGVKSAWFGNSLAGWSTKAFMDEDSTKIVYFSPTLNGISLGVSYAPEDTNHSYASRGDADGHDKQSEQITAALGYTTAVMGASVSAMVGYETYSTESDMDGMACMGDMCDPSAMRYGLTVGIDQIAIGGAVNDQEGTDDGDDRAMIDIGIGWSEGPLGLGLQHATDDKDDYSETAFMVNYNLGGGVDVGVKAGSGESGGHDFTQVLLGTMFNF